MRRAVTNAAEVVVQPSEARPAQPHLCDHGCGTKLTLPSTALQIGRIEEGALQAVVIILDGDDLMFALQHTLTADEARDIARALIDAAALLEGAAADQAAAALAKAGGK